MIAITLMIALAQAAPAAPPAPSAALCQQASEQIENKLGVMLRAPVILSSRMKPKDIDALARIEAFKMKMRPLADGMLAKFPPRPRDQQPTPDAQIDSMDYGVLFAFAQTCLDAKPVPAA